MYPGNLPPPSSCPSPPARNSLKFQRIYRTVFTQVCNNEREQRSYMYLLIYITSASLYVSRLTRKMQLSATFCGPATEIRAALVLRSLSNANACIVRKLV